MIIQVTTFAIMNIMMFRSGRISGTYVHPCQLIVQSFSDTFIFSHSFASTIRLRIEKSLMRTDSHVYDEGALCV